MMHYDTSNCQHDLYFLKPYSNNFGVSFFANTEPAPNFLTLIVYFKRVPDWKKLAVFLLDDDDRCKTHVIEKSNHYDVDDCKVAMIREYLKSGNVSWEVVLDCLRNAGYKSLAAEIEEKLT